MGLLTFYTILNVKDLFMGRIEWKRSVWDRGGRWVVGIVSLSLGNTQSPACMSCATGTITSCISPSLEYVFAWSRLSHLQKNNCLQLFLLPRVIQALPRGLGTRRLVGRGWSGARQWFWLSLPQLGECSRWVFLLAAVPGLGEHMTRTSIVTRH